MTQPDVPRTTGGTNRRNNLLLVVLLVTTLLLSAGAAVIALRPSGVSEVSAATLMTRCSGTNAASCISEAAIAISDKDGPAAGLEAVRMLLQSRPDIQQGCHTVAHEVGNRFFERFGADAIVPGHTWCSWGFYHGLLQKFSENDVSGLVEYATDLCSKVDGKLTTDCMHGVGHAAYVNLREIGPAMEICEQLTGDLAATCADAVIMEEIFLSPNGQLTSGFSPADCLTFSNPDVVGGCARGLTSDQVQNGASLEQSCGMFSGDAYGSCVDGYGSSLAGNDLSGSSALLTPAMFESCAADTGCAAGYGWIAYMYLVDLDRAVAACERKFTGAGLEACTASSQRASTRETLK